MGGFPTSYHGLPLEQLHSPFIVQMPNVCSNNRVGLTYGNGRPGGTPAPEIFAEQDQTSSHAPLSPIIHFPLDPHTRPSHAVPAQGMDISNERPSFTPADNTEDWAHSLWLSTFGPPTLGMDANDEPLGESYDAPESCAEDVPSRSGRGLSPPGADIDLAASSSSSAISGSAGDTAALLSPFKKTVSTPKLRKAAEKRRKNSGRFGCFMCGATFTARHNLTSMYSLATLHVLLQSLTIPCFERSY